MTLDQAFRLQGRACLALGSPFIGRLMAVLADRLAPGMPVSDRLFGWPGDPSPFADSLPLRLAGALHALRLEGRALATVYPPHDVDDAALWVAVEAAIRDHAGTILAWLDSPPQTNEVRRAAAILAGLATIGARHDLPVELLELGTSGGLNLRADRFRLETPLGAVGPAAARVRLCPAWTGPAPGGRLPRIVARRGVDLAPLDPAHPAGRLRLMAYLWPDQPERLALTEAAIAEALVTSAEIVAGDAGAWLEAALAQPAPGRLRVVFHTIAWQYFPEPTKARALAAMAQARGPVLQLAMEADGGEGARVDLTSWPDGTTETLGRADFHGRWIAWR